MSFNKVNADGSITRVAGGTLYADAPIGSYLAMKDNSVKPQGYLLSDGRDTTGTDDELSTKYPLLYAYLGNTNILPTELDHSVLEAPEDISTNLNHTTNSSYYTAPYDGVIIINWTASDRYKSVYWSDDGTNWTEFVYNLDTSTYQTTTVPVKKGDMLYLRDSIANSVIYARFYKQYKYIKATQVGAPADFSPVDTVESGNMKAVTSNAVAEALADTYSTTETKTNKVWIDNKPIYRKVIHYTGVVPSNSAASTVIGSIAGFADIVNFTGTFRNNADNNCFSLNYGYAESDATGLILKQIMPFVIGNEGNVVVARSIGFDITNINIVVDYTKA